MTDTPLVAVIGLDCATPKLLFRDFATETPNIHALMERGMYGSREHHAADHRAGVGDHPARHQASWA